MQIPGSEWFSVVEPRAKHAFYYNSLTGQSQWSWPDGVERVNMGLDGTLNGEPYHAKPLAEGGEAGGEGGGGGDDMSDVGEGGGEGDVLAESSRSTSGKVQC